jgi:hypothetical protein
MALQGATIGARQGFGLALGGLKVRVPLSRELREVSAALVLDVYLKANVARPIAVRVERPVQPVQAVGLRLDIPSQELCATAVGQGNIDVLGVAGPFGLVAPVNGAGFGRSLGHGMSSIDFIVWMQPAVSGSRRFRACIPVGRANPIVTSDSTASLMSPLHQETLDSVGVSSLGFRC